MKNDQYRMLELNPELVVCALAIQDRKMADIVGRGVRPSHFGSPQIRGLFQYLMDVYSDPASKKAIPTLEQVRRRFPWYQMIPISQGVTAELMALEVMSLSLQREAGIAVAQITSESLVTVDAVNIAITQLRDLAGGHQETSAVTLAQSAGLAREWYEAGKDGKITGVPYPYKDLNTETRGMHPGEFILLYGRPKSGKTFSLLEILAHVHALNPESRILFVSFEIVKERIVNRLACMLEKLDYGRFNRGELSEGEQERLYQWTEHLQQPGTGAEQIWLDGPAIHDYTRKKGYTLLDIEQRAILINADIVFIDGLLHAKDLRTKQKSREWSVVSNISSDTKAMAIGLHCPVVCTHQANRESEFLPAGEETQRDIAYSDALAQDADVALRVIQTTLNEQPIRVFQIPGAREFKLLGFKTHADYCTRLDYIDAIQNKDELKRLLSREAREPRTERDRTARQLKSRKRGPSAPIIHSSEPSGMTWPSTEEEEGG